MAIQLTTRLKLFVAAAVVSVVCVGQAAEKTCDLNAVDTVSNRPVVVLKGVTEEHFAEKRAMLGRIKVSSLYDARMKPMGKSSSGKDLYQIYLVNRKNKGKIEN